MKLVPFSILTLLSLIFAGVTFTENTIYHTWERTTVEQTEVQAKIIHYQRLNEFVDGLLRRLAVESQHDPALADLLKQRQIKVLVRTVDHVKDAPAPEASQTTTDKPAQTAPASTSSHL